jgi:hypothetical protein
MSEFLNGIDVSPIPFLVVVRISEQDYQGLNPRDLLAPYEEDVYKAVVYLGRKLNRSLPGHHAIRGPVARRNAYGEYVADGTFPPQTSFDKVGVTKLKPVAIIPLFWWWF